MHVSVSQHFTLSICSWFRKTTSRTQSEDILEADGREGGFLVRPSTQKEMYTLSVFTRSGGWVWQQVSLLAFVFLHSDK